MQDALIIVGGHVVTLQDALVYGAGAMLFLLLVLVWLSARGGKARAIEASDGQALPERLACASSRNS